MVLWLMLQIGTLSAQNPANRVYDRVILGGHVMDPASTLDAVRNIGLTGGRIAVITRSEEHTSELQSHSDLVCRLLLEKKKKTQKNQKQSNIQTQLYKTVRTATYIR